MTMMSYTQFGNELTRRVWAVLPYTQFQLVGDFNNKAAIKASLKFPEGATDEQKDKVIKIIDHFEGRFVQENQ